MKNKCWEPAIEDIQNSNIFNFINILQNKYNIRFSSYIELHQWSTNNIEKFWAEIWEFCEIKHGKPYDSVLDDINLFPGAKWFSGARINFAENLLQHKDSTDIAIQFKNEVDPIRNLTYSELYNEVNKLSHYMIEIGIKKGDRVAGYMPNIPETIIAMLATASIGGIWTSCSPDFGVNGVLDRFKQVEPKLFISTDGYYYKGKVIQLSNKIDLICEGLHGLENIIIIKYINKNDVHINNSTYYSEIKNPDGELIFNQLPFNHPLYIMYSSGTTGKPKSIVHSAGGTLIQHKKELMIHSNLKKNDSIFYFTTCGWMMWNWLVSSLSVGAKIILYDGSPFYPKDTSLLELIDICKINIFGTSAQYISTLDKKDILPNKISNFNSLNTILSTGSPLSDDSYDFVYSKWKENVQLSSISGGTDIISCFVLGNPMLPVYKGKIQCIGLGMNVKSFSDDGEHQLNIKGELVCVKPFPSMPIYFWNDENGKKYTSAYFKRFRKVWTHGDFIRIDENGNIKIFGRSDTTLNPGGVRIGTSEIYSVIDKMNGIKDSVIISCSIRDEEKIVLFVVMRNKYKLDNSMIEVIKNNIKNSCTPRHIPYLIIEVPSIPYTINGKKVELAVKNIINNEKITNYDSLANPESLEYFKKLNFTNV